MGAACSKYGEDERRIQDLVEKPELERALGRQRRGWEDSIEMDL
jgi:hypothetical protein